MARIGQSAKFYQTIIAVLAAYSIFLALVNFYRYSTSTTDENLFRNLPSQLYVTQNIPVQEARFAKDEDRKGGQITDSLHVSDMIVAVNGKEVEAMSGWLDVIKNKKNQDPVRLKVFRTTDDSFLECNLDLSSAPDSLITQIPPAVYVQSVTQGGASDLAGMKKGDLIFKINEQTFSNANEADKILRKAEIGKTISYDIIRNNEKIILLVTLTKFGIGFGTLVFFVAGLVFWGTGVFIALNRPEQIAARLLGLAFLCFGYVMMIVLMQRDVSFDLFAKTRVLTMLFASVFGFAFWLHAKFYFPVTRTKLLQNKKLLIISYVLASLYAVSYTIFLIGKLPVDRVMQFIVISSLLVMTGYNVAIQFIYRKSVNTEYQKICRILSGITVSALILTFVIGFILFVGESPNRFGFAGIALLAIPLAYLHVIGRYRLLDLELRVSRSIQYAILTSIWVVVLAIILLKILLFLPELKLDIPNIKFTGTSFVILDVPPDQRTHDFWEKLIIIFLALAATVLFWKAGKTVQGLLERRFNRGGYNLSQATGELAEIMATKVGMEELAKGVVERLAKLMQLKRVGVIFFRNQQTCCCQEAHGFDGSEWDEVCFLYGNRLIDEIKRFRSESRFSVEYLKNESVKNEFHKHGFRHIIPIRFKDKLVGTFIIGEKRSETPLHLDDLGFLSAVARQASIAIENTFLHEELTEQERLKHELNIARRIQMASLPQSTPQVQGLDIAGISIPAMEVGGDYFDYLNDVKTGITIIVGDVSGKGTSAALYMSKVQGIIRSLHAFDLRPKDLFIKANQLLYRDLERKSFITAIGAFIDTGKRKLYLARAGHLPLFYFNTQIKKVCMMTPKGLGLGLENTDAFAADMEELAIPYHTGDTFLFVTDGITEAHTSSGIEFGEEKLSQLLQENYQLDAKSIQKVVMDEVKKYTDGAVQHDDQTIVVVKAV